jgi:uncharacterized protein with ParB-like and HNH nuclease domain/predicted transport protein
MRATEAKLLDFLKKSPQFVIPIYQRTYSWTEKECRQLWDDIFRAGSNTKIPVHFIGSIVYVDKADANVTTWEPLLVIDGQQRLTTVILLLAALAEQVGDTEPTEGFSAKLIRGYYLRNPLEEGERVYKLLLSQTDKVSLTRILDEQAPPKDISVRVEANHSFFKQQLAANPGKIQIICEGLAKLMMVDVKLTRGIDNPQLIFESMNSTGKELSQADLIRNFVLMGQETSVQAMLYERYWRPMEQAFGQEAYTSHFDAFMRHYLTVKTGDIPKLFEVYDAFKTYAGTEAASAASLELLLKDLLAYSQYFCCIALNAEKDPGLKAAFHDLRELRVDVVYPLLLELYHDYTAGDLPKESLLGAVRLIEAYVFRRAVCRIPTNSLNKTFATISKEVDKLRYLESLQANFLRLPTYRRFPSNEEFARDFQVRDLYNNHNRSFWLRRMENAGRKELVSMSEYTIEHILPQNEELQLSWQKALGPDWRKLQETWLHTAGNLTLTRYNSEYSDRPFLGQLEFWNVDAIGARAGKLAAEAVKIWAWPIVDPALLTEKKAANKGSKGSYTLKDHAHLLTGPMKAVFEALRTAILGLEPNVTEEFLKLYVAFKAETNFVDVVPQASRLRLTLNLRFNELDDPRKIGIDVTGKGRWGNGDVELVLETIDEIPYALALIRQALERQLGD